MSNIILIGMPGSGKSTIGVVLAKRLGYEFVDSDLLIQKKTGMLLHQIISRKGTDGFLVVENEVNSSLQAEESVIATGGSAVYGKEAMAHLAKLGPVVYLDLSYQSIKKRLGNLEERGVVLQQGQSLWELYQERLPLYQKYADITIRCNKKGMKEIVAEIEKRVRRQS